MNFKVKKMPRNKGFTLIEILVVVGLIAILATIVLIAINPARQFAQARNTQRQSNINTILNAIGQHIADNKGVFAGGTPSCPSLPTAASTTFIYKDSTATAGIIGLSCLVPTYIPDFPMDPNASPTSANTEYTLTVDTNGRVEICAPKASQETAIASSTSICVKR